MSSSASINEKELLLFYHILKNMDQSTMPPTNWDLVAEACGYKSTQVAKTRFRQIQNKLNAAMSGESPKKKAPAAKRKSEDEADDNGDDTVQDECNHPPKTPKKARATKAIKTPGSRKKVKTEPVHESVFDVQAAVDADVVGDDENDF